MRHPDDQTASHASTDAREGGEISPRSEHRVGIARAAALLLIAGLTTWLALNSGGFFAGDTAVAAIALILALLLQVMLPIQPLAFVSRTGMVAIVALLLLTAWTLISAQWSGAPTRSLHDYQRTLLYLSTFALFACLPGSVGNARWLVRLIAVCLGVATVAGLAARLDPSLGDALSAPADERLSWPLGYWNALGLAGVLALLACLQVSSDISEPKWARVLAASSVPALAVAVFLTLSRGAIVAGAVGLLLLLLLARGRGTPGTLLAVVPWTGFALIEGYDASGLTDSVAGDAASAAAGAALTDALALAVIGAAVSRVILLLLDSWLERARLWRPLTLASTSMVVLTVAALGLVGGFALGFQDKVTDQYDSFLDARLRPVAEERDRLGQASANGRLEHWDVAVQTWRDSPLIGQGAGTYARDWARLRPSVLTVQDAHSLYFEALSELGMIGLILLAVALLAPLGKMVLRRQEERRLWSAVTALFVTWLLHAGVDWDWEMPALTLPIVALMGAACARQRARAGRGPSSGTLRLIAGLGVLLLLVTPIRVAVSQHHLEEALVHFGDGRCGSSIDSSLAANEVLGSHPAPFELIGFCDVRNGRARLGVRMLQAAVRREPLSWELHYGLGLVRAAAGRDPRPALRRASRLNPLEARIDTALQRLESDEPEVWRRRSRRLPLIIVGG